MKISIWKDAQQCQPSGKWELKPLCDITTCLSEWLEKKSQWQQQMLASLWRNWITHTLLVGMLKSTVTLGNSLAAFFLTKHAIIMWPSSHTPRHLSQNSQDLCSHKYLFINVYSSFTHSSSKLETSQMPFNRCMNKLVHSYRGYHSARKGTNYRYKWQLR